MPAHGRQWLWRNHGIYTHLAFLWFASLISSPGHRGVSPQAHRSGFCIIHISPSFYFICFFWAAFPLFLNIWVKKKNVNYRRLWIDVMWKEGGCFPSLQRGNIVFKTNIPLKPHEAHFNLFKWLFSEGKRRSKEMCLGQCLARRQNGPSLCTWSLSPPSGPRSHSPWRAWEGKLHS